MRFLRACAEEADGEIAEQIAVGGNGAGLWIGDADEVVDRGGVLFPSADGGELICCKASGLELVVVAAGIANDIMVVERESQMGGVVLGRGEEVETEGEVVEGVEVAAGLSVAGLNFPPSIFRRALGLEEGE